MTMKPAADQRVHDQKPKSEIELSSLYWYDQRLPAQVGLMASSLKVTCGLKGAFHALYGHRGRQDGFMAARAHAIETGQLYTAIDMRVQLERPITQLKRSADNIADQEIFPAHLLTTQFAKELDDRLRVDMHLRRNPTDEQTASSLLDTLAQHPSAVAKLLSYPEFEHIKVIVHLAQTEISSALLPVATIPQRHLSSIVEAKCRLDPELIVTLPVTNDRSKERASTAPAPEVTPAPRR